jgi:hypothetical protein
MDLFFLCDFSLGSKNPRHANWEVAGTTFLDKTISFLMMPSSEHLSSIFSPCRALVAKDVVLFASPQLTLSPPW